MIAKKGFLRYLKKAFSYHWNLLAFGAAAAAAIISGQGDVLLPLVLAGELMFVTVLASRPRFQAAVDREDRRTDQLDYKQRTDRKLNDILSYIQPEDRRRFEQLKGLCLEMDRISRRIRDKTEEDLPDMISLQMEGLNRLLWIFLKLLHTKNALERFFSTTRIKDISNKKWEAQERLAQLGPQHEDDPREAKLRKSLLDTISTSELRISNYHQARENYDFVGLELERLHSKIAGLAEMGINRQDASLITSEIDLVSNSLRQTEKTLSDLNFLTELSSVSEEPPLLLEETQ